jgi:hypothetical protein
MGVMERQHLLIPFSRDKGFHSELYAPMKDYPVTQR